MKSTIPVILGCALMAILALGMTTYGFASGNLLEAREKVLSINEAKIASPVEFEGLGEAVVSAINEEEKIVVVDMNEIPDNLTTDKSEGSTPLVVEGISGEQYDVTDEDGNPVYVKDEESNEEDASDIHISQSPSGKKVDKSELYIRYNVRRGDTLSALSNEFGSSVDTLVRLNNINNPNLIYTGEVLHVPSNPPVLVSEDGEISEP